MQKGSFYVLKFIYTHATVEFYVWDAVRTKLKHASPIILTTKRRSCTLTTQTIVKHSVGLTQIRMT